MKPGWVGEKLFLLLILLFMAKPAVAGNEWHYWSTWSATHRLTPHSTVSGLFEADFRDQMSDDYVYFSYLTYAQDIGHGFGWLAEGYWEWVESAAKDWSETHSVVGGLTYSAGTPRTGQIKIQDRFFYRYNARPKMDYHRPRVTLTKDIGAVALVISDEMRVDLSGDRKHNFFRNRLYVTLMRKVRKNLSLGIGIVRQEDRASQGWKGFNVLQTVANITF